MSVSNEDLSNTQLAFEREKWKADVDLKARELALREREQNNRDLEVELRRKEQARSRWSNPLTVAILAAAIAGISNAVVTFLNGRLQQELEESKAESSRILEVIKAQPNTAATNLTFLLDTGLITNADRIARLQTYLEKRPAGGGPSIPPPGARFGFEPSNALTSSIETGLESSLRNYITYLDKIEFPADKEKILVKIEENSSLNSSYNENDRTIIIDSRIAGDIDVPRYHYTLYLLGKIKPDLKNGGTKPISQIQSALSDYFICSFSDRPVLGEVMGKIISSKIGIGKPYLRNLANTRTFNETSELQGEMHDRGEIWGGAFWEIRSHLGQSLTDRLLVRAWRLMTLPGAEQDTALKFIEAMLAGTKEIASDREIAEITNVLRKRKFPVPS